VLLILMDCKGLYATSRVVEAIEQN
jgi:hypothetical protein